MDELARKYDVGRSYVWRILQLTSLAPDIVEAVLAGSDLEGIRLRNLQKPLPVCWRKQRERWCGVG